MPKKKNEQSSSSDEENDTNKPSTSQPAPAPAPAPALNVSKSVYRTGRSAKRSPARNRKRRRFGCSKAKRKISKTRVKNYEDFSSTDDNSSDEEQIINSPNVYRPMQTSPVKNTDKQKKKYYYTQNSPYYSPNSTTPSAGTSAVTTPGPTPEPTRGVTPSLTPDGLLKQPSLEIFDSMMIVPGEPLSTSVSKQNKDSSASNKTQSHISINPEVNILNPHEDINSSTLITNKSSMLARPASSVSIATPYPPTILHSMESMKENMPPRSRPNLIKRLAIAIYATINPNYRRRTQSLGPLLKPKPTLETQPMPSERNVRMRPELSQVTIIPNRKNMESQHSLRNNYDPKHVYSAKQYYTSEEEYFMEVNMFNCSGGVCKILIYQIITLI